MGEDPRGKPGNLLPLLAAIAVGRYSQDGLKVFGDDYPTQYFVFPLILSPLFADNLNDMPAATEHVSGTTYTSWISPRVTS
jgi:hypothetical protein